MHIKSQVIEIKLVRVFSWWQAARNAGGKYEGKSHYVIENTWRKNVRFEPCHYVDENKPVIGGQPLS
jgi:hypothetical protein